VTSLPIAVDAMGGDRAPGEIVAGAVQATKEAGIPVVLVGDPDVLAGYDTGGLEIIAAREVVAMDEDAGAVRRKKDSSLVRAAEAVRDGKAAAMVSAGNTGATMASALLRMGRLKGISRPAIATPVPIPDKPGAPPRVLLDAGANAECSPQMLVQFAQMGSVFARHRFGVVDPRVGLLSIGEEESKGTPLVKETHGLLKAGDLGITFIGNVEGRDIMKDVADVIVTDGFTGNVTLKTMEGTLRSLVNAILGALNADEEVKRAAEVLLPQLLPLYETLDPETYGGAMLLGLQGVCIISHGSSSARAIVNAVKVAKDMVDHDLVGELARATASGEASPTSL
jgi:glycerol-3-phosphate acyltransferase PlsX